MLLKNFMVNQKNNSTVSSKHFLNLAFEEANKNLGKTKLNPSVGCVVVKNNSVISSGHTSIGGRPHAEYNALNIKKDFNGSSLYVTLEPCSHYGVTPPCTNLIIRKGIKKVYYSFFDDDIRTSKKLKLVLSKKKVKSQRIFLKKYKSFYQSYSNIHKKKLPYIDGKIAISKDYLTISKKSKWITNERSRKCGHFLRSQYDSILCTSKTINKDNAMLNCRINGLNQNKPDLIIIDLKFKLKKNLKLFKLNDNRKITIIINKRNKRKMNFFKNKGLKIILINSLKKKDDFYNLMNILLKKGYNRILCETGITFLNSLLRNKLIYNLFIFKSDKKLGKLGYNSSSIDYIKKVNLSNKVKVNLKGESLYKIKLKNV